MKDHTPFEEQLRKAVEETSPVSLNPGHRQRFSKKLQSKPGRTRILWVGAAATVLVLLSVGLYFGLPEAKAPAVAEEAGSYENLASGLAAMEQHLEGQLQPRMAEAEAISLEDPRFAGFMEELNALELEYGRLKEEWNRHGADERLIQAMLRNYRLRLELLESMFFHHQKYSHKQVNT